MNKLLKKSLFVTIMLLVVAVGIVVSAASTVYNTIISISDNSTLNGTVRDYSYNNYQLAITPTKLEDGQMLPGYVDLVIELRQPKTILGWEYSYDLKWSGGMQWGTNQVGVTQTRIPGNCGSGDRYFYFSTVGSWGAGYGAIDGAVAITNYS